MRKDSLNTEYNGMNTRRKGKNFLVDQHEYEYSQQHKEGVDQSFILCRNGAVDGMDRLGGGILVAHDLWATNEGICIDTEHRNLCGVPVNALRIAGSHLITLHIQDNHGEQDEHLLPDLGQINSPGVSQVLKDIDYQGVFMYE